jgi:hypothetical protein
VCQRSAQEERAEAGVRGVRVPELVRISANMSNFGALITGNPLVAF